MRTKRMFGMRGAFRIFHTEARLILQEKNEIILPSDEGSDFVHVALMETDEQAAQRRKAVYSHLARARHTRALHTSTPSSTTSHGAKFDSIHLTGAESSEEAAQRRKIVYSHVAHAVHARTRHASSLNSSETIAPSGARFNSIHLAGSGQLTQRKRIVSSHAAPGNHAWTEHARTAEHHTLVNSGDMQHPTELNEMQGLAALVHTAPGSEDVAELPIGYESAVSNMSMIGQSGADPFETFPRPLSRTEKFLFHHC